MPGANVGSAQALIEFRAALIQFQERAEAALGSLRQESQRTMRWLTQDQPHYWQTQLRRGFDHVAETRVALETCRMRTVAGHRSACIEEQVAHRKAKARLEYVQQQIDVVRRWGVKAGDETNEFLGKLGPLERSLDQELPQMIAALGHMVDAIEAYAMVARDSGPSPASAGNEAVKSQASGAEVAAPEVAEPATHQASTEPRP